MARISPMERRIAELPVAVELAVETPADAALAEDIRARLRDVLVGQMEVELVPWGSLQRTDYKSRLVAGR
jgi:phenylacetate-CoA ligase